ncbi:hypothetical protein [Halobacillus massiliensis]|uniref:hypothetical protein n=1 Tax=Halobacillus massiliensis TaxID=1926286 RepID=UPI0009E390B4|nr:hypothetical protein [Halobacillus massiliensis]
MKKFLKWGEGITAVLLIILLILRFAISLEVFHVLMIILGIHFILRGANIRVREGRYAKIEGYMFLIIGSVITLLIFVDLLF